jgi:hypothetical protein
MSYREGLLKDVLDDTPEARGRLLIDLVNEPDGYSLTWDVRTLPCSCVWAMMKFNKVFFLHASNGGSRERSCDLHHASNMLNMQGMNGYPSLSLIYIHAMDRLWQICRDCLFLVEGDCKSSRRHSCSAFAAMFIL